jgi:YidC/Oxa1 family membrane protein insertase
MDRNFVVGMVLMTILFVLWINWGTMMNGDKHPLPLASQPEKIVDQKNSTNVSGSPVTPVPATPATPWDEAAKIVKDMPENTLEIRLAKYTARISSIGGSLISFQLNEFLDKIGPEGRPVEMIKVRERSQYPFQLLLAGNTAGYGAFAPFEIKAEGKDHVVCRWQGEKGIAIEKKFTFADDYSVSLDLTVSNQGTEKFSGTPQLLLAADLMNDAPAKPGIGGCMGSNQAYPPQPIYLVNGKLAKEKLTSLKQARIEHFPGENIGWAGFSEKYFMQVMVPLKQDNVMLTFDNVGQEVYRASLSSAQLNLAGGESGKVSYTLFLGPKDVELLTKHGVFLESALDLGMFGGLARIFLQILKAFHRFFGNYGVAIIFLTILVRAALYPLAKKSYVSMKKMSKDMQKVQPQLAKVKEKYYNKDNERYQKEVMEIYKKNNVNPVGCFGTMLPTFAQIPVFIALYMALTYSVELRHAPFMLWIRDLSAMDQYLITPILMGISMYISQKMTPTTTTDPNQARIMNMMPIMFTFMFLSLPSGLILYWLVSNVFTITQQYYLNKTIEV